MEQIESWLMVNIDLYLADVSKNTTRTVLYALTPREQKYVHVHG